MKKLSCPNCGTPLKELRFCHTENPLRVSRTPESAGSVIERLKNNKMPFCFLTREDQRVFENTEVPIEALQNKAAEIWWPLCGTPRSEIKACHILRVERDYSPNAISETEEKRRSE